MAYDMRPSVHAEKYGCPQSVPKSTDALSACRKVHVCHCNSLGGATWRSVTITGRTDRRTDRQSATQYAAPPREEGRIIIFMSLLPHPEFIVRRCCSTLNLTRSPYTVVCSFTFRSFFSGANCASVLRIIARNHVLKRILTRAYL